MDDVYDALVELKISIDKQNELQEQTNTLLRSLIGALQGAAQASDDLAEELQKSGAGRNPGS